MSPLLLPIFLPIIGGLLVLMISDRLKYVKEAVAILVCTACFVVSVSMFHDRLTWYLPWAGFGFDFSLRLYPFAAFILLAVNGFGLLISIYSSVFMSRTANIRWYYFYYLMTLGFTSGAVLADNFVLMLFFWEGLLVTLYTFIALGKRSTAKATAMKAFLIVGVSDLCLLLGIAIAGALAGSMTMSSMKINIDGGWAMTSYILIMIGAISKAGAMPFHTWIPDAALDAPLPFMAFLPASLEKLLGIYLLARISLDLFVVNSATGMVLMIIGAVTIVGAVMMALVQTDYKRLLSYHAISQVGYMVLGIGTGNPIGIAGGIFHMVNHAVYKACLFLSGGSVERKAGTTHLSALGGLFRNMPVTAVCFIIAAASISGVPPFNGFFSKELVFDGAMRTGHTIFFWAAELGAVLTLASFLKLGHSVYFGKRPSDKERVAEAEWPILVPMVVLALICVIFGFGAKLPLTYLIGPSLAESQIVPEHNLWGWHIGPVFFISIGALILAVLNHIYGVSRAKKPQGAADHIHHAPGLKKVYDWAERRFFDPYDQGMKLIYAAAQGLFALDRIFDWLTDTLPSKLTLAASKLIRTFHNGLYPNYLAWVILGFVLFALLAAAQGGLP